MLSAVLRHVCDAVTPASAAQAAAARSAVASAGAPLLERLAAALAGAQHTPQPRAARRTIVVAIGDHGCGDPGISMAGDHPSVVAAHAIASGTAALAHIARTAHAPIVIVDAGAREPEALPSSTVRFGLHASRDLLVEPAMTIGEASQALDAGIALAVALAEPGLDLIAVGAVGVGAEVASTALLAAATGRAPVDQHDDMARSASLRGMAVHGASALEQLAALGGPDTALLAGLMLGAASMNIPTVLDGCATGTAALVASAFAPSVVGYLIAAHRGSFTHPEILAHLKLLPIFEVGIGHGEGTGAAMVLPIIDQVAAIVARC